MQGGNGNSRVKWGPLITSMPPDSPTFAQEFQGGGHLFLSRANGAPVSSPHQTPWEGQSPRGWRGQFPQHGAGQDVQWSTPPPPGVGSRTLSHRGMRNGPVQNIQGMYGSPPQGHVNGGGRRLSNSPSNLAASPQQNVEHGLVGSQERGRRPIMSPDSPSFPVWSDVPGRKRNGERDDKFGLPERVATRVYNDLLAGRKGVSTGKVAQATLSALGVPSFESLGVMPNEIPCLRKLSLLEGKVNAFIHSHVAGKKITTLYDLSVDLTRDEGVKEFEDLGLGPLLCHPLVGHYFTPPVGAEVHKITAGEVIQLLSDYIGNLGKDTRVQIDNFLSFIQKERSLPSPQHLCIKIQSLGMHIGFIRRAKKAEKELISIWESRARAEFDKKQKPSVMERVNSFLAAEKKKAALGKRKFPFNSDPATGSEDDLEDDDQLEGSNKRAVRLLQKTSADRSKKKDDDDSVRLFPMPSTTNCPYPSEAEERARQKKQDLRQFVANSEQEDFYLSGMELQEFVTILKDACENRSVHEVLMKMIEMSRKFKGTKKRSGKSKIFKAYPAIGLLNVAVLSVKAGYWDSMYDNFLDIVDDGKQPVKEELRPVDIAAPIDVFPDPRESSPCQVLEATSPELLAASVLEHYDQHSKMRISEEMLEAESKQSRAWWTFLHWTYECEKWLAEKHSVPSFASLGFGSFPDFLEQNMELLPRQIISLLSDQSVHSKVSVKVPVERVFSFLTQALPSVSENGSVAQDDLLRLLCRQFKVDSVEELGASSVDNLLQIYKEQQSRLLSNSHVYFLAPLLGSSLSHEVKEEGCGETPRSVETLEAVSERRVGVLGSMTSADAARSMLKAPFLADLSQWSQWDQVFAPTLGPLLGWFEREGVKAGLHALVTCEGVLLRIDEKATVNSFLLATVSGRGDQMAAVLTSLVALYGGTTTTPSALLRSHANKGLEIFLGSCAGDMAVQSTFRTPVTSVKRKFTEHVEGQTVKSAHHDAGLKLKSSANLMVPGSHPSTTAARCVVDCLHGIIPEFRVFAAEILLPALTPLIPGCPAALLSSCVTSQRRSVLHCVGLALGIPEWINDYNVSVSGPPQLPPSVHVHTIDSMDVDDSSVSSSKKGVNDKPLSGNDTMMVVSNGDRVMGYEDAEMVTAQLTHAGESSSYPEMPQHKVRIKGRQSSTMQDDSSIRNMLSEKGSMESDAKKVVEEIRRTEFGMGQDIGGTERDLLARQHARMGRALHRLSSDLYSQDSHFVLELVQNADDNSYAAGVEAALVFLIQEGRIVVLNNEVGFTAVNMRALCDVGNSTKAGTKTGYIGHKGIGFKSVFRVTNSPEIHSNGFHVKFDISEGDIGFILPTIVPHPPGCQSLDDILALMPKVNVPKSVSEGWNTRIDLPVKAAIHKGGGMNLLASKFSDLHPSLLLFLHRLRCIAVRNEMTGSMVVMHREDLGDDLVKVVHEKGTATWMVVRRQLKATVHRPGITGTEIALAFQLHEVSEGIYEACSEQQQVFAFLPLRAYGLRFIVQGDFIVPSSREEVDCDSDWNQWLRTEIPDVFIQSAQSFQKLISTSGNPGKAISSFMSFVPMEGEVLGFFSPLPRMIMSRLRATACLPVEGGGWALPCVLLRGWSIQIRHLLPDAFLKEHLGLCYLDNEVVLSDILASKLGVQPFGAGTLIAVMRSLCHKKGALLSLGLNWVEAWLSALHDCFESDQLSHHPAIYEDKYISYRMELQTLPFIPLSNGSFTALADGPVWFAGEMSEDGLGMSSSLSRFLLLSSELRTVHPSLLSAHVDDSGETRKQGSDSSVGKVVSILQRLGVSRISSHEVMKSHILPAMASEDCMTKEPRLVAEYLGFFMSHLETSCMTCSTERFKIKAQLQKCAVILTSHGLIRAGQQPIHFGTVMGNQFDMRKILEGTGVSWIEVSPLYMQLQAIDHEAVAKWRRFFKELGVTDFVQVVAVEKKIVDKKSSDWCEVPWEGDFGYEGAWFVQDWQSAELTQILTYRQSSKEELDSGYNVRERCASVLIALDRLWDDYYYQFCQAFYRPVTASESRRMTTVSSFKLQLQQFSWAMSSLDEELHPPKKLFRVCDDVRNILGAHAPYVLPPIQNDNFMDALGLRTQVLVEDALLLLRRWSVGSGQFKASVAQMTRLYVFLWESLPAHKESILDVLQSGASIFVPQHWNRVYEEVQIGTFYPIERVCWSDPTHTLNLVTFDRETTLLLPVTPLSSIYHGLHEFFVFECRIQEKPNFDGYLEVLRKVAAKQLPSAVLDQVMEVFYVWSMEIAAGKVDPKELVRWKRRLEELESCVFPTNQDKWVSLNAQTGLICVCDDENLGDEFKDSMGCINFLLLRDVDLLKVCGRSSVTLQPLVQALSIPKLSEAVEREVIKYGSHDCGRIEALIGWVLPYAQRYLRHHHIEHYNYLQNTGITESLKRIQFVVVDQLYFQYCLRNSSIRSSRRTPSTCLLQMPSPSTTTSVATLHVVDDFGKDYCNIYVELSRFFFNGKSDLSVANFLHLITLMASSGSPERDVENFISNRQGIQPIPEGEDVWTLGFKTSDSPPEVERTSGGLYLERHVNHQNLRKKVVRGLVSDGWPPHSWKPVPTDEGVSPSPERIVRGPSEENSPPEVVSYPPDVMNGYSPRNHGPYVGSPSQGDPMLEYENGGGMPKMSSYREKPMWDGVPRNLGVERGSDAGFGYEAPQAPSQRWQSYPEEKSICSKASGTMTGHWDVHRHNLSQMQPDAAPLIDNRSLPVDVQEVIIDGYDPMLFENGVMSGTLQNFQGRDYLAMHPLNEQQREVTGRSGEALVFQYLARNYGPNHVKWINQEGESGAAYDIVILKESGQQEFVEVKATRSGDKDWFEISPREWDFARQHAEYFTIMRVFFGPSNQQVKLLRLPNPVKLAQDHIIQLALLLPATQGNNSLADGKHLSAPPDGLLLPLQH
ncbi:hypothetical protein AXG93_2528s1220 [Marchantia polymorpha subsp. ruderalis]|uniref:Protein NO VEIN C-terminal domain-containing protein n=1 Tax=Marchantia polymorpha subsp. ruderalis TaxID=1480154 RepID=A0A176WNR2_MARPO|nr:hypothetical protein AXG93_2528s1220 [Marchantia polymorpha subsp. ruderalis]